MRIASVTAPNDGFTVAVAMSIQWPPGRSRTWDRAPRIGGRYPANHSASVPGANACWAPVSTGGASEKSKRATHTSQAQTPRRQEVHAWPARRTTPSQVPHRRYLLIARYCTCFSGRLRPLGVPTCAPPPPPLRAAISRWVAAPLLLTRRLPSPIYFLLFPFNRSLAPTVTPFSTTTLLANRFSCRKRLPPSSYTLL